MVKLFSCLALSILLLGCSDNEASESKEPDNQYAFVYSDEFLETFDMDPARSVELPKGVNAIRAYKSKFSYGETFNLQLYLDNDIQSALSRDEKVLISYDTASNGFMDFSGSYSFSGALKNKKYNALMDEQAEFFDSLVITYSKDLAATAIFLRYTNNLIPGYTLMEVVIPGPDVEAIYLYTGNEALKDRGEFMDLTNKLAETDDLSAEGYLKIPLPEEIQTFYMNNCGDLCPP